MIKRRILLMSELGWQLNLTNVAGRDDDNLQAETWQSGLSDELVKLMDDFGGRRFSVSLAGVVGDDEFSQLLLNWCDAHSIDTSFLTLEHDLKIPLTLKLASKLNRKDDIAIVTGCGGVLPDSQALYGFKKTHDFYLIDYHQIDLNWLNETLHQARLNGASVALYMHNLRKSDAGRFKILLEDVEWLVLQLSLATKIFNTENDDELATRLNTVVKNTICYADNKIILVRDGVMTETSWDRKTVKMSASSVVLTSLRELMLGKKSSQALMTGLMENCGDETLLPQISVMEQKI